MNRYYEVVGTIDNRVEVLFGSFDRSDCTYELDAERPTYLAEGYTKLKVASRMTTETPDPEVYGV